MRHSLAEPSAIDPVEVVDLIRNPPDQTMKDTADAAAGWIQVMVAGTAQGFADEAAHVAVESQPVSTTVAAQRIRFAWIYFCPGVRSSRATSEAGTDWVYVPLRV
jgi:hypothetical protein